MLKGDRISDVFINFYLITTRVAVQSTRKYNVYPVSVYRSQWIRISVGSGLVIMENDPLRPSRLGMGVASSFLDQAPLEKSDKYPSVQADEDEGGASSETLCQSLR